MLSSRVSSTNVESHPQSPTTECIDEPFHQLSTEYLWIAELSHSMEENRIHNSELGPTSTKLQRHRLKLDVPHFNGYKAHGWTFNISQFFMYHDPSDEDRITIASFYLGDPTLSWYQWMYWNNQIVSWPQFLQALETWFTHSIRLLEVIHIY